MVIGTHISKITINVNGLNASTKRHRLAEWIQKQNLYIYAVYKRPTSDLGTHMDWKWGEGKRYSMKTEIKRKLGLPWWRSGWESACRCRGHGFEPSSGKIPCAAEQLGPWATITEPAHLEPVLQKKKGRDSERPAHCDEEWPPLATTRESPRMETKTQHSHK